jgi:cell division protein FtsB
VEGRGWPWRGARPGGADLTDARPAAAIRPGEAPDPQVERKRRLSRRAGAALLGVFAAIGAIMALFGEGGFLEARRLRREIGTLRADVELRRQAVRRLEDQWDRLQRDPLALERIARERLGLARPGEIEFLLPRAAEGGPQRRGS